MEKGKNYSKLDAIIDFAIRKEQKSRKIYSDFAVKVSSSEKKALLEKLAGMEKSHEKKLQAFKESGATRYENQNASEPAVDEFAAVDEVDESSSVKDFLLFAIGMEKKAYDLYMTVRDNYVCTDDRDLFEALANDELMHRQELEKALKNEL